MKKILAMILAVALVLALAAGCSGGDKKDGDSVYIGVYEPQSGAKEDEEAVTDKSTKEDS